VNQHKHSNYFLILCPLLLLALSGCCNYKEESACRDYDHDCWYDELEGSEYEWTITSDFDDNIEITYTEKEDKDKTLLEIILSCPPEDKEDVVSVKKIINAFSGYKLKVYIERYQAKAITVKYVGKSVRYYAEFSTISVKLADFL